ncbi:F-box protein [Tripterygium wilfordii]|uniref:F-box protein n=1 Tax=Tripterygium wilfordii TaxID=458696 RepID=A0A7J7D4V1_TRIWF|nr:F-box protein At3g07870-like [Tripterygium wilfordii]KAF5741387.1 F-box protein [Tripterygium wilfordii]
MKSRRGRKYRDKHCIKEEEGGLSLLPDVIVMDILSRLPLKTIIQSRCVCKTWQSLLSDSYFASLLQQKARPTLVLQSEPKQGPSNFYMVELESGIHGVLKFNTKNNIPTRHVELLGSCNGLLCLFALNSIRSYYLCNPITGQFVNTPSNSKKQKRVGKLVATVHGFGFSPESNQYMVLRITNKKYNHPNVNLRTEGEVYTFGTDNWRSIGEVPFPVHHKFFSIQLNGALHWIAERDANGGSDIICSLNIDTKKISTIATPPDEFDRVDSEIVLGVLEGCLYICDSMSFYNLEIWLLKNYGVESSWSREIVIAKTSLPKEMQDCVLKPIMRFKNGEILIQNDCNYMILYDPRRGSFVNVSVGRVGHEFKAAAHVASFDAIPCLTF